MVQEIQKRRIRCGEGGLMTVQEQKQTTDYIPDISTLLRVGHFYFALTLASFFLQSHEIDDTQ